MNEQLSEPNVRKKIFKYIIAAGLLAGTLDITAALLNSYISNGTSPVIVFQYIASGILGNAAFSGGFLTVLLGIIIHYLIAFTWTIIFFKFFPKIGVPSKYKILSGLIYGIIVWLIMNLIIVPASNTPEIRFHVLQIILGICFLMFLIGLPISLIYHIYKPMATSKSMA